MHNELLSAQQGYVPQVEGVTAASAIVVCGGMGGSALPAEALRFLGITSYVIAHRDYELPASVPEGAQYVALSYSGNTEETLSFAHEALAQGHTLSVVTSGGELLALAKERGLPYVLVPAGLVPRDALLSMTRALLALLGEEHLADEVSFDTGAAEAAGEKLVLLLHGRVPLFYASTRNLALAKLGAILMNETAKQPAFANALPELNHNEMQGFASGSGVSYAAVFLEDGSDDPRLVRRIDLSEKTLAKEGASTMRVMLPSGRRIETLLYGWWLLRTAAHRLAREKGIDPDATPLIDAFKREL